MNRFDFQRLAGLRIKEAQLLLDAAGYEGAYYLAGYAVECALKACIAKKTKQYDFPDKRLVGQIYKHDPQALLQAAELQEELKKEISSNRKTGKELGYSSKLVRGEPLRCVEDGDCRKGLVSRNQRPARRNNVVAEEVVVKDQLTDRMLSAGRALAQALADTDFELICALWLYSAELNRWRFVVASPRVDTDGPLKVYEKIQEILATEQLRNNRLELWDISAVSPNHELVKALKPAFEVAGGFANIRFTRSRVGDVFVEDSHILFLR